MLLITHILLFFTCTWNWWYWHTVSDVLGRHYSNLHISQEIPDKEYFIFQHSPVVSNIFIKYQEIST